MALGAIITTVLLAGSTPEPRSRFEAPADASMSIGDVADRLKLRTSVRLAAWTHDRDLNGETVVPVAGLRARIAPRFGAVDVSAEGYVQTDRVRGVRADLVEGWARLTTGAVELRAGRQIVAWGRADRLNPTDTIASRDYTLLVASDDEQRRGPAMVQARWGAGAWTLDAFWLPEFRPNVFPLERDRPGIAILPHQRRRSARQFAAKLDNSGGAFDWSLSVFDGIDRNRDFTARAAPRGSIAAIEQTWPRITVWGGDAAGVAGPVGWRVEAAYSDVHRPEDAFTKNDNFWIVAGGDATVAGWNLNLQYSFRRVFNYADPRRIANPVVSAIASLSAAVNNQLDRTQNGVTARVARRFANDTLDVEVSAVRYFETGDSAVRPRATYAISDGLRLIAGVDVFTGPPLSYFGRVRSLTSGYLQLTAGF